jgi:hypothetical protein
MTSKLTPPVLPAAYRGSLTAPAAYIAHLERMVVNYWAELARYRQKTILAILADRQKTSQLPQASAPRDVPLCSSSVSQDGSTVAHSL